MNIGGGWQEMKKYGKKAPANDGRSLWHTVCIGGDEIG